MTQRSCPVCKTAVPEDAGLCPECGWEIGRATGELIIGDPEELQQEAERKQRRLQHYRRLYQQAMQINRLEKRLTELEQERQTTREAFEQRFAALEDAQQQNVDIKKSQHRLDMLVQRVEKRVAELEQAHQAQPIETFEQRIAALEEVKQHIAEIETLRHRVAALEGAHLPKTDHHPYYRF